MRKDFNRHYGGIEGLDDAIANLNWSKRESKNLARAVVAGTATEARNMMRQRVRDSGIGEKRTLEKALVTKRQRPRGARVHADVWVTHGSRRLPHDAFWWHWLEWPTQNPNMPTYPYINPTIDALRLDLESIWRKQFGKKLESAIKRRAKAARKARGG